MKTLAFFILLLVYTNGITSDIEKYSKAYYVIKDSSIVNKCFSEYYSPKIDNFQICISNRIYYMNKIFFIDRIVEYEYGYLKYDDTTSRHIKDSLLGSEYLLWEKPGNYENYKVKNEIKDIQKPMTCDLKLFFGDFDSQNRLRATLIYDFGEENFRNAFKRSQCGLEYLFYFQGDAIIKVIISQFER